MYAPRLTGREIVLVARIFWGQEIHEGRLPRTFSTDGSGQKTALDHHVHSAT
jgi:hypothetical protein